MNPRGATPELSAHLSDMQARACRLSGILSAIAHLQNSDECREGKAALIFLAEELAKDLNTGLDSTRIPKGVVA
jgi:hypothetical protein